MARRRPDGHQDLQLAGDDVRRPIRFATPMLFCCAFLFHVPDRRPDRASCWPVAPFDWQLTDSYFVVAHFHFVLIGGLLFGDLRGDLLLVPEGDRPDADRAAGPLALLALRHRLQPDLRHLHFGVLGMPRRIYTYQADRGWEIWNLVATARRAVPGPRRPHLPGQRGSLAATGQAGGRRPVGRLDAGVVDDVAAAARTTSRRFPRSCEPPAALGPEAPRRPGLAARMRDRRCRRVAPSPDGDRRSRRAARWA